MNVLNWLCCRQKHKQHEKKPIITTISRQPPISKAYSAEDKFSSQPFNLADKYKGEQKNGVANGNGEMMYKNGDYYRGQWVNGQKQGRGLQIYNEKGYRYEGEWKGNLPNGQGKVTYWDGSYYIGGFKDNNRDGKGEFYDFQNKKAVEQFYQNGILKHQKAKSVMLSKQQQFPTLVLDKQRFNSQDLLNFQKQNPQIKQLQVQSLANYYAICKIIKLPFIKKPIKQWDDKQVREFLQQINLSGYKQIFYKNKIKGKSLITITEKEMREDLRMKLGDRRRLANYCKCLGEMFSQEKKRKQGKKAQNIKRPTLDNKRMHASSLTSHPPHHHHSRFKTAYVDQGNIIQQQLQLDSSKQIFQKTDSKQIIQSYPHIQQGQGGYNNYETEQWVEYQSQQQIIRSMNDQVLHKFGILEEGEVNHQSERESMFGGSSRSGGSVVKNVSLRKISKEENDQDLFLNLPQKLKTMNSQILIPLQQQKLQHGGFSKPQQKQKQPNQSRSSSSGSQSDTITDSDLPDLIRKKTTGGRGNKQGGMQIRQLYEFLKLRGNLQFIIKQREIQLLQLIGEGGYGKVYKGKYMSCPVAVKDYIKTRKHQNQEDFLKQLEILCVLKHPNIVLYMGICITTDKYQLVTQYLQNGSLFDQLHKKKKRFTKQEIYEIVDDIVKGMVYLHNMKKIMHRDLKSSNVLLDEDLKVKLCDFGLSGHKKKSKKKDQCRIGTYQWMAPEVMKKQQMDFSSDVYSFGVILWQLLTNKIPYQNYTQHQIIGQVGYDQSHKLKFDTEGTVWESGDFIVQLMEECLNRMPEQRPTFIQIQSKLDLYINEGERGKEGRRVGVWVGDQGM